MVFLKHKTDGKIDQFLMTIVGDKPYHLSNKGRLENNSYLSKEKHFSGYIYYHDLNGKFVNGWMFEKGEPVGAAYQNSGEALNTQIKMATTCITVTTYTLYVICTDWYDDSNRNGIYDEGTDQWTNTTCGAPYEVESNIVYCPSFFTGDNSFSSTRLAPYGGTNGGYDPTVPPALPQCDCLNVCPVCHKCKDALILKSAGTACTPAPVCTCAPDIDLTPSFTSNSKVMCVYGNLIRTATSRFNPLVTTFIANFSTGLTVDPGDITFHLAVLINGEYGKCLPGSSNDKFIVTINQNTISNRAPIEIAHTLIHEILHAQLKHQTQTSMTSFIDIYNNYITSKFGEGSIDQHQLMKDNYLQPMINFLKNYDSLYGLSCNEKYYRGLALIGLNGAIPLTQLEINEIYEAQNYFRNRGLNCQ